VGAAGFSFSGLPAAFLLCSAFIQACNWLSAALQFPGFTRPGRDAINI